MKRCICRNRSRLDMPPPPRDMMQMFSRIVQHRLFGSTWSGSKKQKINNTWYGRESWGAKRGYLWLWGRFLFPSFCVTRSIIAQLRRCQKIFKPLNGVMRDWILIRKSNGKADISAWTKLFLRFGLSKNNLSLLMMSKYFLFPVFFLVMILKHFSFLSWTFPDHTCYRQRQRGNSKQRL